MVNFFEFLKIISFWGGGGGGGGGFVAIFYLGHNVKAIFDFP